MSILSLIRDQCNCISERSTPSNAKVPIGIESTADDPQCYVTVPCLY